MFSSVCLQIVCDKFGQCQPGSEKHKILTLERGGVSIGPLAKKILFTELNLGSTSHQSEIKTIQKRDNPKMKTTPNEKMPQSGVGSMQGSNEDCLSMKGHTRGGGHTQSVSN